MGSIVEIALANALLAGVLAGAALLASRYSRRPALVHSLWLLVLVKLVTPPLVSLPIPWLQAPAPPAPKVMAAAVAEPDTQPPVLVRAVSEPPPLPAPADVIAPPGMRINELVANNKDVVKSKDAMQGAMSSRPVMAAPSESPTRQRGIEAVKPPPVDPRPAPKTPTQEVVQPIASEPAPVEESPSRWPELLQLLACVWLVGAVVWYLRIAWRVFCFQRLLRFAREAPESLQQEAQRLAAQLGLRRCPGVWLVPGPVPPLLWAVGGRARVFFPESLLKQLEEPGRSALLVHELAHLRRRDHLVRWLELLVAGLYWWYPLVWLACRRLQAAEEECCDAWVVSELPGYGAVYAGALLETVDFLSRKPEPLPPIASGFGRMHHLKRRLAMIVRESTPRGQSLASRLLILALAPALLLMPTRGQPSAAPAEIEVEKPKKPAPAPSKPVLAASIESDEPSTYLGNPRNIQGGGGQVWAASLSPDGKTLAVVAGGTGNNEGTLTLWDMATKKEKVTLLEPKPIRCVAFSPDGKTLATGDFDFKTQLRDPATGAVRHVLGDHKAAVNSVAFTPDSKQLVTGSLDHSVKFWNVADGKYIRTIEAHKDWVLSVAVSPDGKTLVTTSRDQTAKVWNLPDGKLRHTLTGHTNWVENSAISPDNKLLATTGHDNVVKLWDSESGKLLNTLAGHTDVINTAVFSQDGKTLFTCSQDRTIRIWDVATGNLVSAINTGHEEGVFAFALTADARTMISGSWDRTVKVWDTGTSEEKATLRPRRYRPENDYPVLSVACSPDGKTLAVAGEERTIKLLDTTTGSIKHLLEGHEDVVGRVVFSPDGKTLASAGFDGNVILWNAETGKRVYTLTGHANWVFSVAFSPDGKTLASGGYDRTIRLWNPKTGKSLGILGKHRGGVRSVAFSPDGLSLASGGTDKTVRVWNLRTQEETHTIKGHDESVRSVAFSADSKSIVSGADDNTVRLWDVATEKQLARHNGSDVVRDVAFSPRGRSVAIVSQDRSLRILDPQTLTLRNSYSAHTDAVTCVCYSLNSTRLYTGGADRTVREWQAAMEARRPLATFSGPGKQMWFSLYSPDGKWLAMSGDDRLLTVRDTWFGRQVGSLDSLDSTVYGMAVSPDGKTLATGCQDMTIKLWDMQTRKLVKTLKGHQFRVWTVCFSPDGKHLASAAGSWAQPAEPGEVKVWDLAAGKEVRSLSGHTAPVQAVAWSANGKLIATGSRDGLARLFEAGSGKELFVLRNHTDSVRSVAFDPESRYLATGGIEGTVRIWRVDNGKEIGVLKASPSGVNSIAWSPDGKTLAATSKPTSQPEPGEVRLWQCETTQKEPIFTEKSILKGHSSWVLTVAFSPDSKTLASAGGTYEKFGEVILWDLASGKEKVTLHGHRQWIESVVFSKDGKTVVSAGGTRDSRGEARFWSVGETGWTVPNAHKGSVCCAAWSPDGKTLATGSYDKTIKLWDAATGKVKGTLTGHDGHIRCLAFRPDGKMLASASTDKTVKLWDVASNTERAELTRHQKVVVCVSWAPDGKLLATASADPRWQDRTGEVKVFDVDKARELTDAEWAKRPAMSVIFSHDGKKLITGRSGQGALQIYNVATGKQERVVEAAGSIRMLTLSKDGKQLATSHGPGAPRGNGSIQVWDTTTWKERATLRGVANLCLGIDFSPDGKLLAGASTQGTVQLFDVTVSPTVKGSVKAEPGKVSEQAK